MTDLNTITQQDVLTICIDIADPYSHLALPGTLALLLETGHCAHWRAFTRPPMQRPAPQSADEDRGAVHRRLRGAYRERELHYYAKALGLPLKRLYHRPDSAPFASALLWLNRTHSDRVPEFVSHCFNAYWAGTLPVSDCQALGQQLQTCTADADGWLTQSTNGSALNDAAQQAVTTELDALRSAGLFNTPAYIYNGEIFYGRAHLPLLAQLLGGGNA